MWWFTLEGCKQPWQKSSQTWWDWTWDCRSKWNKYCHKCIRSENLPLYMEDMYLYTCRLQAWLSPVGSEHVPGRAVWLCKLYTSEKSDTSQCQLFLGRYSLQILEVGWKSWGIRKLLYETSLVSNACKSSQLDMPGINYNVYTCVVS